MNLRTTADFKISEQKEWGKAGYAIVQLDFAKYKNSLVRRAGIINDRSFLEVQLQTQSKKGKTSFVLDGSTFRDKNMNHII